MAFLLVGRNSAMTTCADCKIVAIIRAPEDWHDGQPTHIVEPCSYHASVKVLLAALERRSRAEHNVSRHIAGGLSSVHAGDWEDCPLDCQADRILIAAATEGQPDAV